MRGPQPEKLPEKPATEETTMLILRPPPAPAILPPDTNPEIPPVTTVALVGAIPDGVAKDQTTDGATAPVGSTDPSQPDATGTVPVGGEAQPAPAGATPASLFVGTLIDPVEEAAKAAAAAEVQAQQEATMAALDEAKASSAAHVAASPVGQVWGQSIRILNRYTRIIFFFISGEYRRIR